MENKVEDIFEPAWRASYNVSLTKPSLEENCNEEAFIYTGAFDVLLKLISDKQIGIMEVKLSELTDQYLEFIKKMEEFDMDISSDFIVLAAKLLKIKSMELVAPEVIEEEQENLELDLKYKLMLYKMFKDQAEKLKNLETRNRFYKLPDFSQNDVKLSFINFSVDKMINAYVRMLAKVIPVKEQKEEKKIEKYEFSLTDRIKLMLEKLMKNQKLEFLSLFNKKVVPGEIISSFLAILELCKNQATVIEQNEKNNLIIELRNNVDIEKLKNLDFDKDYTGGESKDE